MLAYNKSQFIVALIQQNSENEFFFFKIFSELVKLFISKYSWEKINYQSKLDDWKKFEKK